MRGEINFAVVKEPPNKTNLLRLHLPPPSPFLVHGFVCLFCLLHVPIYISVSFLRPHPFPRIFASLHGRRFLFSLLLPYSGKERPLGTCGRGSLAPRRFVFSRGGNRIGNEYVCLQMTNKVTNKQRKPGEGGDVACRSRVGDDNIYVEERFGRSAVDILFFLSVARAVGLQSIQNKKHRCDFKRRKIGVLSSAEQKRKKERTVVDIAGVTKVFLRDPWGPSSSPRFVRVFCFNA